jgi:hypothetical protein
VLSLVEAIVPDTNVDRLEMVVNMAAMISLGVAGWPSAKPLARLAAPVLFIGSTLGRYLLLQWLFGTASVMG